jgi:hypothetical protein
LFQKFSKIKLYNALDLPILLFEIEICILRKRTKTIGINRDESFQKKRQVLLFDHKRNEEILEELKVEPID